MKKMTYSKDVDVFLIELKDEPIAYAEEEQIMKTYHFQDIVNSEGKVTLSLSGLPPHKKVEIVVLYPETQDAQEEMKLWLEEIRQEHPFRKMKKEEILVEIRKNREEVYDELYSDRHAHQLGYKCVDIWNCQW